MKIFFGTILLIIGGMFHTLWATDIEGIRITSSDCRIVVYVDGRQVCPPIGSCFVAHVSGDREVEVFAVNSYNEIERTQPLYRQRVFCKPGKMVDIRVSRYHSSHTTDEYPDIEDYPTPDYGNAHVMNQEAFNKFIKTMKQQTFQSDRRALLEQTLLTAWFTSAQCKQLISLYNFSNEKKELIKKMYPRIVDKENFFTVLGQLNFSSDKKDITNFIREYHRNQQ